MGAEKKDPTKKYIHIALPEEVWRDARQAEARAEWRAIAAEQVAS